VSELAFSFGRIAAEYDDVRPDYAPESLDRAEEVLGLEAGSRVVDLAAGSGKLTRALVPRFAEVVAVEPNDEMRGVLAGRSTMEPLDNLLGEIDLYVARVQFSSYRSLALEGDLASVRRPRRLLITIGGRIEKPEGVGIGIVDADEAVLFAIAHERQPIC